MAALSLLCASVILATPTPILNMETNQLGPTAAPGATAPENGEEVAVLTTGKGRIVLKFFPKVAPKHVENFKKLVNEGFYDGTRFHRTIKGFMIQGGDPLTKDLANASRWGTGGPETRVKAEFSDMKHTRGVLSMARSSDPDSAGSQFFVMHQDAPHLDHQYSAFGIVVEGMDVVDKIIDNPSAGQNGMVAPESAVVLETVVIKPWPL